MNSRFDAEVEGVKTRTKALRREAEVQRLLQRAEPHPRWRSALAAYLRAAAERLEPQPKLTQPKLKGIL